MPIHEKNTYEVGYLPRISSKPVVARSGGDLFEILAE
jgi:hypothetical protein